MGLTKLLIAPNEADPESTNCGQTARLSLVCPEETELDVLLQKLSDIIESERGILIP